MFKKMHITFNDGTERDVLGKRADLIAFERHFGIAASTLFTGGIWTERMWFLAWAADRRENPECPEFDEWTTTVDVVEIVRDEDEADPPTNPDSSPTP